MSIVVWQWHRTDPEAASMEDSTLLGGEGLYWRDADGMWMPEWLPIRWQWREIEDNGYMNIMRYWPGEPEPIGGE